MDLMRLFSIKLLQSSVQNTKAVDMLIKVKWLSKDAERKLPKDLEPLSELLARGTYKQIANAAWQNKSLKKELSLCSRI